MTDRRLLSTRVRSSLELLKAIADSQDAYELRMRELAAWSLDAPPAAEVPSDASREDASWNLRHRL